MTTPPVLTQGRCMPMLGKFIHSIRTPLTILAILLVGYIGGWATVDPRTLAAYVLLSTKNTANGYVGLDGSSNVSIAGNLAVGGVISFPGSIYFTSTYPGSHPACTALNGVFAIDTDGIYKTCYNGGTLHPITNLAVLGTDQSVVNLNATTPSAGGGFVNCTPQASGGNLSIECPIQSALIVGRLDATNQGASIGTTPLLSSAPAASYVISLFVNTVGTCATPGPGGVTITITYVDSVGTVTISPALIPYVSSSQSRLATTVNLYSSGTNNITIAAAHTACSVGTGTFDIHATLESK